jgi:hypothetical protein
MLEVDSFKLARLKWVNLPEWVNLTGYIVVFFLVFLIQNNPILFLKNYWNEVFYKIFYNWHGGSNIKDRSDHMPKYEYDKDVSS